MRKRYCASVYRRDDDFELAVEAMSHLRKLFLTMPFEKFVIIEELRRTMVEKKALSRYLISLGSYLDFGIDSFRYFMMSLEDALTKNVVEADSDHDIHTDMRGRINNWNAKKALGFAMGFQCLSEELGVEELGYERDPGYAEETVFTELGILQISGLKNTKGNFHGYCEILQPNGALQRCFFNDGKPLARRIEYANGMCEDVKENVSLAVDPYAPRLVYELCNSNEVEEDCDSVAMLYEDVAIRRVTADRETVERLFNTLGNYSLRVEYRHYVRYPYDEGEWETEESERTPTVDMALIEKGQLIGVYFKSNGRTITSLDSERRSNWSWEVLTCLLDQEFVMENYKVTLNKKGETADAEK